MAPPLVPMVLPIQLWVEHIIGHQVVHHSLRIRQRLVFVDILVMFILRTRNVTERR